MMILFAALRWTGGMAKWMVCLGLVPGLLPSFSMQLPAQPADSVRQYIDTLPNDTAKVNALHQWIMDGLQGNNNASKAELREARQLSETLHYDYGLAYNDELQGLSFLQTGLLDSAQYYFLRALTAYEKLKALDRMVLTYGHLGRIQVYKDDFDKAESYFKRSLDYAPEITDHGVLSKINNNMAAMYIRKGWYLRGKNAPLQEQRAQFQNAVPYLEDVIRHGEMVGLQVGIATGYVNLGLVQMELANYPASSNYLNLAKEKFESLKMDAKLAEVYGYLGELYELSGDYAQALYWTHKGLDMALSLASNLEVLAGYQRARKVYERMFNYRSALRYQDLYDSLNAIMLNQQKQKSIDELEIKYETEKQRNELLGKQSVIDKQRLQIYFVLALFVVVGTIAYLVWRNNRRVQRLNAMLAEKSDELRKTTFELIRKNAELNESAQQQSNLMAIVAHDLRAPLNSLKGLMQLMSMTGPLTGEQEDVRRKALQVAADGIDLVNDIYTIRDHQVEEEPNLEPVDLEQLIADVVMTLTPAAQTKQIDIKVEGLSPGVPMLVHTDRLMLVRILNNLISNAIKFSYPQRPIIVQASVDKETVQLHIKDQGPGISEEDQQVAFQRFKKLSARPTGGESSSGLGLFIVKKLVEKLSGSVAIESKLGQGTTFIVAIPA